MLSSRIKTALVIWCLAEVAIFVLLIDLVGLGWTIIAGLLTSAIGMTLLKRTGAATLVQLRASFRRRLAGEGTNAELIDHGLTVLGALALTVPGFLSDLAGLALLTRPMRDRLTHGIRSGRWTPARRDGSRAPRQNPEVIDLPPDQWREAENRPRPELRP